MIKYDLRWRKERGLMIYNEPSGAYPMAIIGIGNVIVHVDQAVGMVIESEHDSSGFYTMTQYDCDGVTLENREEYEA